MSTMTLRLSTYTPPAKKAVASAQALAEERKHVEVEPLHLLYRLVEQHDPIRAAVERAGIDPTDVLVEAEAQLRKLRTLPQAVPYMSPRMLELMGRADGEAARDGGAHVSVEHLTLACAQEASGATAVVLRACGLSAPVLRETLAGGSTTAES